MSKINRTDWISGTVFKLALLVFLNGPAFPAEGTPSNTEALYSQLPWRYVGPEGNRVSAVAGIPGDPRIYYAGTASGDYRVELSVGDKKFSEPLIIRKDPHSGGALADIEEQTSLMLDLRRNMEDAVELVNQAEMLRSQLEALNTAGNAAIKKAADALDEKLIAIEDNIIHVRITGALARREGRNRSWCRKSSIWPNSANQSSEGSP